MVLRATLEKKEEKERSRTALLRATLRLAAVHGFSSLGLREVAREAGIAPTSFYRHFADMEDLGTALIRELVGSGMRSVRDRVRAAPRGELASVLVDSVLDTVVRDPELLRFIAAERTGAFASFRMLLRSEFSALAHALHEASSGEPSDVALPPSAASDAVVVLMFDGCTRALDEPGSPRSALRDSLLSVLQRLLAPSDGSSGSV